mmetsp:Transcript_11796/g.24894  ORF Transcript_11796/g.24894 Transcript_11796/m.24894 type:complete len:374 (+) Transcript_11796:113-1234(+)
MADQKKLVRRGGGAGSTTGMMIEEPPVQSSDTSTAPVHPNQVTHDLEEGPRGADAAAAATTAAGGVGPGPDRGEETQPLSIDQRYTEERMAAKVRHWREGELAAGLVELTWTDELGKHRYADDDDANGRNRGACADCCREEMEPTCGCLYFSGLVCSRIGAGRVGNMAILKESTVVVEEEIDEPDDAEEQMESEHGGASSTASSPPTSSGAVRTHKVHRRRIDLVVGPYWPMMLCVTYPLILGMSFWTLVVAILPGRHPLITLIWFTLTVSLIYALFGVAFRDPGILPRHRTPPSGTARGEWRWNDQCQTYRPRGAVYDPDCAVVIEGFDHTCPWTGTGIGRKNMTSFQAFVALVFICLIMDILLLTSTLPTS